MAQELGVLVATRLPIQIFEPKQPQRHPAATQLLLNRLPIRQRARRIARLTWRKELLVQCLVVERQKLNVIQAGGRHPVQIVLHRRTRYPRAKCHPRVTQPHIKF